MNQNQVMAFASVAALAAAVWYWLRQQSSAVQFDQVAADQVAADQPDSAWLPAPADTMPDQLPGVFDSIAIQAAQLPAEIATAAGFGSQPDPAAVQTNRKAFLDMISYSEGTTGAQGYRTMFGGTLADSLDDHPRQVFTFTNKAGQTLKTSAAGRYQFLARTWDELRAKLGLKDFGPASQDAAALELIRQRGALPDVDAGRIEAAIAKVAPVWASLPGAGYNQPERKLSSLIASYSAAGGNLEQSA